MKNKFLLLFIIISIILSYQVAADDNKFEVENIEIKNSGNLIVAKNGKFNSPDGELIIIADRFQYNKENKILNIFNGEAIYKTTKLTVKFNESKYSENNLQLIAKGDIKINDTEKNLFIESDVITFDRIKDFITAEGNIKINDTEKNLFLESELIIFDRINQVISSKKKSIIKDSLNNIFLVEEFDLNRKKNLIKIKNANFKDYDNNNLKIKSAFIDTNSYKILGKDISIDLNNKSFAEENEPRIKGKSVVHDNDITEISKGVFTPCRKTDKCPPWQLSADKIKHNKSKKTINYENVWLKIYDVPIVYFPKFFHPDPTVKRQTGFLFPSFKTSANKNTFLTVPYYKVLDANKDITFSPRFYAKDQLLLQTEYREINKADKIDIDLSVAKEKSSKLNSHFFLNYNQQIDNKKFDRGELNFKIENTSNDTYLKANDIVSPIINEYDTLENSINLNLNSDNLDIKGEVIVYENLNQSKSSDKYQYIFPKIDLVKKLENKTKLDGNFIFKSNNFVQNYQTNIWEKLNINNLIFESNPKITGSGFYNNYEFLVRNANSDTKNSEDYKSGENFYLSGIFQFNSSLPLIKNTNDSKRIFTPKISFKLSPNNNTKDVRNSDDRLDVNNIFNLDRLSINNTIESGISMTYGADFSIMNKESSDEILGFKFANNLRLKKQDDLPNRNQLGSKTSNFFAEATYRPSKYFTSKYNISTKNNLYDINYENLSAEININNFVTTFDYLNENNFENNSYLLNKTSYNLDKSKSISFSTRQNKKTNLTEYYNLIYQYKNDCLIASLEYKKNYYEDRDIKPEESIFFRLSIVPFGETSTPNLKK